ncbi:MAG: ytqA [Lachnospiraceae bacterium]|jgi:radical SAM protein (TIGR01212 family)|nr:ytqA [Lachnospiraceae bacterium]
MKQTMWGDKRYYSLDTYLKTEFGRKIYKLSLNGGMTCPNRDGTLGNNGCIFCSAGGSGDFAASFSLSITEQIEVAKQLVESKMKSTHSDSGPRYIAYFQAYTNTYAKVSYLREIFTEAINHPDIAILSIATRPDCLGSDILDLLTALNRIKPVWIELGLQTCHQKTADFIRRGYSLSVFEEAVEQLHRRHIDVVVHVILGLPRESVSDMLETVSYVSSFHTQGIKLQLLHILKDTDLAGYPVKTLTMEEYVEIVISCLELLPPAMVVHRITGDGPKDLLIAPTWSANKKMVLNRIQQELKERDTWQGRLYKPGHV